MTDDGREGLIRLLSFNIRYATPKDGVHFWEYRKALAFETIRTQQPDVFGVQEALDSQNRDLEEAFPQYGRVGVGRDDGDSLGEHCSLFYLRSRWKLLFSGKIGRAHV